MNKFMKVAIKEATKGINAHDGGPFGCVIVKDGKIIAKAHNQVLKSMMQLAMVKWKQLEKHPRNLELLIYQAANFIQLASLVRCA